jgi:hypothetical protein
MRKSLRASYIAIVSLVGALALVIGSAFSAALAFGAIGLLVPGTGTPDANNVSAYLENARDWYMQGTACNDATNCGTVAEGVPNPTLQGIDYPASFWPLAIFPTWCRSGPDGCDKWNESVGKGAASLTAALEAALATPGTADERDIVLFGYSQGGAVLSKVLREYGLTEEEKARLEIVTIGGIENPDGGLWQRLAFLRYIPILNLTFGPPMPVDPAIKTTTFGFEYDPVVYAPRYWGNPFAMLNALAAFDNVHGYYLSPNGNGLDATLPYGYTPATLAPHLECNVGVNCRLDQYGNEYIMIPATSLPIMNLVMSLTPDLLKPLVKPIVDLISPVYKVLADLGYDWSGNPGTPTPLSILPFNPFQNWVDVGVRLVAAAIQGIHDAFNGGPSVAPLTIPDTSVLAARSFAAPSDEAPLATTEDSTVGAELASQLVSDLGTVTEPKPVEAPQQLPVIDPVVTDPVVTDPVVTDPVVTDPVVTQPVVDEVDPTVETVEEEPTAPAESTPAESTPAESTPVESTPVDDALIDYGPAANEKDGSEKLAAKKDLVKRIDAKRDELKKALTEKDETKKVDAKPTKKAGESDARDSGADDKKAAA